MKPKNLSDWWLMVAEVLLWALWLMPLFAFALGLTKILFPE